MKQLHAANPYFMSEDDCWNFYNKNIAYQPYLTEVELVLLRTDETVIKIPVSLDNYNYRQRLSDALNIEIQRAPIFTSRFDLFGQEVFSRVYLYKTVSNSNDC